MSEPGSETPADAGVDADRGDRLSPVLVALFRGVLHRDAAPQSWQGLLALQARVRDYVAVLGLELMLDEAEGYAYLRQRPRDPDGG
ncbi:DUF4194 domain-containing protein, partial [Burkholderia sp. SIMBA_024]|uniref:DUF4194 domain-containing protein n=1 Tax=Burkholderia sp. SIMBA_024 TaxID=3085768 RepID=UPI00397A5484